MESRTNTLDKFSTFLELIHSESKTTKWTTKPQLRRNIQRILSESDQAMEDEYLALAFLAKMKKQTNPICGYHLTAYLQEVSYQTSQQVFQKFSGFTKGLTWQDYFSLAMVRIAQPELLLCNYNENKGAKITTYVKKILAGKIANDAYTNQGWQLCSDWGLLRKMSRTARRKALQKIGGLANDKLEQHLLIWNCFVVNYEPINPQKSRQLPPPTSEQFKIMTEQYNLMMVTQIKTEVFQERLEFCAEIARKYINPQTIAYPENLDFMDESNNPMINLEKQEKQEELNRIKALLSQAIKSLSKEEQIMLEMWKGLKITQQNIAIFLTDNFPSFKSQQYEISRQIERARKKILQSVLNNLLGDQSKLNKARIEDLKSPLEECLDSYCFGLIDTFLWQEYKKFKNYQENFSQKTDFKITLKSQFQGFLRDKWELKPEQILTLDTDINTFLDNWIETEIIGN